MLYLPEILSHYLHKQQTYDEGAALAVAHLSIHQRVRLKNTKHHISCALFSSTGAQTTRNPVTMVSSFPAAGTEQMMR